ncbi:MAG: FHA domain-containing protein [Thermodesulfobacteriota bacterium]|nr:FHA domain-containing protein [Thermodesulfobacteriota bacterium]
MPTLILKFNDNIIGKSHLKTGESVTIGRGENNDVVIENLAVSVRHAKVDSVDDGFLLTDLKSKNGSFINKQLVTSHWLKHGDVINIGKHTLVFEYDKGESRPAADVGEDMDRTMMMDTNKYRDMLAKSSTKIATQMTEDGPVGALSFLAGGEGDLELSKKLIKIGKQSSCDIVVSGLMMGQIAATVSKRPNGYYLSYVGGMSKPKVNGDTVKGSVMLKEFDVIEIGSIKMQLVYHNK